MKPGEEGGVGSFTWRAEVSCRRELGDGSEEGTSVHLPGRRSRVWGGEAEQGLGTVPELGVAEETPGSAQMFAV